MLTVVSGVGAHQDMHGRADISVSAVLRHQNAALIKFTVMEFAGFVAWITL